MTNDSHPHWLYRRRNRPILWMILMGILLLTLVPEFFIHHHAHFPDQGVSADTSFGFFSWYGFLACTGMVIAAKILGVMLKRKDTYYDD